MLLLSSAVRDFFQNPACDDAERIENDQNEFMLVRKGARVFPLEEKEVALVYKDSTFNYVKTFAEDAYIIDGRWTKRKTI